MKNAQLFVSLLAMSAMCFACEGAHKAPNPPPPPGQAWLTPQQVTEAQMKIDAVRAQDVDSTVTTSGRVTFDDLRVSHVFSPVTGRVDKITAQLGQRVKKGDMLALIESPDLGVASSDVERARADFTAAQRDFQRQKSLYEAHAGAQRDFESAEDNYYRAKAEFERAQQKTKLLLSGDNRTVSQAFNLRATIGGEVIARNVNPGMEVQGQYSGGSGVELFTIGELDSVWVLGDVFEMDLERVEKDQKVTISVVAYPGETFEGVVDWVSAALDPATRTAKVRCSIPNKERKLKPEMFATVQIAATGRNVLAVPRNAMFRLGGKTVVFVQTGNTPDGQLKFERRPVVADEDTSGDLLPVSEGLTVGDKVVTSGGILLADMTYKPST